MPMDGRKTVLTAHYVLKREPRGEEDQVAQLLGSNTVTIMRVGWW